MKPVLPILLTLCLVFFSCQQAESPIRPLVEESPKIQKCHLAAEAIVGFREARNGASPFFYLTLLDQKGNETTDVYTPSVQGGVVEVGETISIEYHYKVSNGTQYTPACGDDPDHQPTKEELAQVEICDMNT